MLQYEVVPHVGVNPIHFGMPREQVHDVMPESPLAFKKTPLSRHSTDAFHQNGFQVFYTGESPTVEFIELSRGAGFRVLFRGIDVFATPASELVPLFSKHASFDENDAELGYSYVFPALDLSVWRPTIAESPQDEDGRYFMTIGIGVEGYYAASSS